MEPSVECMEPEEGYPFVGPPDVFRFLMAHGVYCTQRAGPPRDMLFAHVVESMRTENGYALLRLRSLDRDARLRAWCHGDDIHLWDRQDRLRLEDGTDGERLVRLYVRDPETGQFVPTGGRPDLAFPGPRILELVEAGLTVEEACSQKWYESPYAKSK